MASSEPQWEKTSLIHNLSSKGHFGCFSFELLLQTKLIFGYGFLCRRQHSFLWDKQPGVRLLGCVLSLYVWFFEKLLYCFSEWLYILHLHQHHYKANFSACLPVLVPNFMSLLAILIFNRWAVVLWFLFAFLLMATDIKHLPMCLFVLWISPSMILCILIFAHFQIEIVVFSLLSFESSLYIPDISVCQLCSCKNSIPPRPPVFSLFFKSFWWHLLQRELRFKILSSIYHLFSVMNSVLMSTLRALQHTLDPENFPLCFLLEVL